MIATNIWFWVGFVGFVLAMLALDLGVFHRKPHEVRPKEAAIWTSVWVALALVFAAGLHALFGRAASLTFLTGYVIEESLSVDNIFVIVLIFDYFRVPRICQHRVLFYGILGALVMRGLFIGLGAVLIARFHWILYLFGAMLVITGIRMAIKRDEEFDGEENPVVRLVRRVLPMSKNFDGKHFFVVEAGRRLATPLLLVLILVEFTDLIFDYFRVPRACQHRVLFYGILGALLMRGLFIGLGAVLIARFHWILYLFGAMLVITGIRMAIKRDEEFDGEENPVVRLVRRVLPMSKEFHGKHFFVVEAGRRLATPLLLVLILVEFTDLIFAVDSIPATFGVTTDPFLVFTSNIFAILGLRSLYFLLAAVVERFYLLKYALAAILTFVGVKMLGDRFFQIDIVLSLAIILGVLVAAVVASLVWPRPAPAHDPGDARDTRG